MRHVALLGAAAVALAACRDYSTTPTDRPPAPARDVTAPAAAPVAPVDLGTLGGATAEAVWINDDGYAVGRAQDAAGTLWPVLWHPDGTIDKLPLESVVAVSNTNVVAGIMACVAATWSRAEGVRLGGSLRPNGCSSARAISDDGVVVGSSPSTLCPGCQPGFPCSCPGETVNAFSWRQGSGMQLLPTSPLRNYSAAYGVNSLHWAVGEETRYPGFPQATCWGPGIQLLGPAAPYLQGMSSIAQAVNSRGTVIGVKHPGSLAFRASCATGSPLTDLLPGVLGPYAGFGASAINDRDEIVVRQGNASYLYRADGTLVELGTLGGLVAWASSVNERSQVVGWSTDANGRQRAVRWDVDRPNRPPAVSAGGPYAGTEGSPVAFAGAATDPDGDQLTIAWSFGDGATAPVLAPTHAYADDGAFTATLTATDGRGGSASASVAVTLANAPPAVDAGSDATIYSGDTFTLDGAYTDPGMDDAPWAFTIDWGDGRSQREETPVNAGPVVRSARYLRAGAYTVTLSVVDKDGGRGLDQAGVTVLRLPMPVSVEPASINVRGSGHGMLSVTLLSTDQVDATTVSIGTATLGDGAGIDTPVADRNDGTPRATAMDADGDGRLDLVVGFRRDELIANGDLTEGITRLVFHADLADGRQITGDAAVRAVGKQNGRQK